LVLTLTQPFFSYFNILDLLGDLEKPFCFFLNVFVIMAEAEVSSVYTWISVLFISSVPSPVPPEEGGHPA
jgi:hypothetical protein